MNKWEMKEILLFAYLPSLLQASSSIVLLLVLYSFADLIVIFFGLPTWNPLCLKYYIGTAETSSIMN